MVKGRFAAGLVWMLILTTVVMVAQARPAEKEEDDELALSGLQGKGDAKTLPVTPEEQSLLNSELEALKEQEVGKTHQEKGDNILGNQEILEQEHPNVEEVQEPQGPVEDQEEEVEDTPSVGEAVDEGDISWANMGYSAETLSAIGNMVREVERSLLRKKIASEHGRLRAVRLQKKAVKKDEGPRDPGTQEGVVPAGGSAHVRRRRSTGVRLPYAV